MFFTKEDFAAKRSWSAEDLATWVNYQMAERIRERDALKGDGIDFKPSLFLLILIGMTFAVVYFG